MAPILQRESVKLVFDELKHQDKCIGMCHGCFDILHYGHLIHFNEAKESCDILVVSVTPDEFVNKGVGRPIFTVSRRAFFLSNLRSVDFVYVNDSKTAISALEVVKPHIFFKGADYQSYTESDPVALEINFARSVGIKPFFTKGDRFSTTRILKLIGNNKI